VGTKEKGKAANNGTGRARQGGARKRGSVVRARKEEVCVENFRAADTLFLRQETTESGNFFG